MKADRFVLRFATLAVALSLAAPAHAALQRRNKGDQPPRQYTIEQFLATTSLRGASFSHDESHILYSSNETGVWNVFSVPTAGGRPAAVTTSTTDNDYAVSYFPNDDRILYTRDHAGNEQNHLYVREKDGSEKDLTPGEKLKAQFGGWTQEGDAFYLMTNERDPKYFDVYLVNATDYARTTVYQDTAGYVVNDISPDRRWITLEKENSTADNNLYLRDAKSGETKLISPHTDVAQFTSSGFDLQSHWLYFATDEGTEFKRLSRYELATGKTEDVEKPQWDVTFSGLSHQGRYRVTSTNEDARTVVRLIDNQTGKTVSVPGLPAGDITGPVISWSEKRIAFYLSSDRSSNNLYVYTFGAKTPMRLTNSMSPEINPRDLVDAQIVRFASFDGMQIPNVFYKPLTADAQHKAPAIVWVHGGPGDQTRRGYSALIQFLANHGYVILGINNRGSSGYGKTFYTADDGKHGHEPLWDCVSGKKYLQTLPYVDPDRIAIVGGSYGGYMVLAALAYQPEEFRAGVDLFGISNWVRTLKSIPSWWEAERKSLYQEVGNPDTEEEKLRSISPLFAADKITKPLMVLQGANDPRVIKPESDDIVAAVKKNNVPVEYIVFDDEGHGFAKRANQIKGYGAMLTFLDKYVKGNGGATAAAGAPTHASQAPH
jgi:dipeptidyl aminopeptidase/acylaminoacyl peptidase